MEKLKQEAREEWDNLHENRTTPPSRKEIHSLSDSLIDKVSQAKDREFEEMIETHANLYKENCGSHPNSYDYAKISVKALENLLQAIKSNKQ